MIDPRKAPADASAQKTPLSRRAFVKVVGVGALGALVLGGCSSQSESASDKPATDTTEATQTTQDEAATTDTTTGEVDYSDWDAVVAAAKGQTVTWYGWGGSEPRNTWINTVLAPTLKEKYDITLDLVGMDINDILTQLSGEMNAGIEEGTIDFIWINGENFFSTKENGYLWGPFTDYLPNFKDYINADSAEVKYDFGTAVEGYEAPYGKTQMQMWCNTATVPEADFPKTTDDFLEFCKAHEGQVTYPEPGDFTGTAFISCLIAGVIGKDEFEKLSMMSKDEATEDAVKAIVQPGLDYLKELAPYLWKKGATYPSDSTTLASMFADGEVIMNMGYGAPQALIDDGQLPDTVRSFIFDSGTVGNTNYMAIAANAPHKAGALVCINEVESFEMQLDQYIELGNLTVLDYDKLDAAQQQAFDEVPLGVSQLPTEELLSHRIVEAAGPVIPVLEQLWLDEVAGA